MAVLTTDVSGTPTITIKNPTLIKDVQESSSSFGMQFEELIAAALRLYKRERMKDEFFARIESAEFVSDEENTEIETELDSMAEDDRKVVKTETVSI